MQQNIEETYNKGNTHLDRTNHVLHRMKIQTPMYNVNKARLNAIKRNSKNKVSYAYKERFTGIYDEMKKTGRLKRENSWNKFVNPDKIGIDNYM